MTIGLLYLILCLDLESLGYETILAGVPEIFADTDALNFKEYSKVEARPNQVIPAHTDDPSGLSSKFFQPHSANLSKEAAEFRQNHGSIPEYLWWSVERRPYTRRVPTVAGSSTSETISEVEVPQ
jgi:hypothetical protein